MRAPFASLALLLLTVPLVAQPARTVRRPLLRPETAEQLVKQSAEQLVEEKKVYDRDIAVLRHLQSADEALADDMQRANAIQKAFEEVGKARQIGSSSQLVAQGLIRMTNELESARRSSANADFGRLRSLLREHASGPASRVARANALKLEEEMLAWLKVQELVSVHLRQMAEVSGESLRASQE